MHTFRQLIEAAQPAASVIISVALMLLSGFPMTRLTKLLRLPNVTAYIIAGILIGPYCLDLVPQRIIDGTDFLSDIALAFIAFSTGEFFKLSVLKKKRHEGYADHPARGVRRICLCVCPDLFLFSGWSLPSPSYWRRWLPLLRLPRP